MSHDLSRQLYAHIGCGNLPCSCTWDHPPLAIVQVHCWTCTCTFHTVTEMANHHLAAHEQPVRHTEESTDRVTARPTHGPALQNGVCHPPARAT